MYAAGLGKCNALAVALALLAGGVCVSTDAQAQAQAMDVRRYEIPAGQLAGGLKLLAIQSRLQLLAPPELTRGLRGRAVSGTYTAREALEQVLAGSGLSYEFVNASTVVIKRAGTRLPASARPTASPAPAQSRQQLTPEPPPATLDAVTVTGTRIRGGSTPSPVITIGSERIEEEGFSDLGEVIRSIPQNFGGGQNPGVSSGNLSGAGNANQNITGGSSLNLRGLGPDATLTLLNGRRLGYSGYVQAVDIGSIPVEAVERVELIADGASAIYGSDAVGGVGNVILKRDFEGVTVGTRYGGATDGGLATHEYSATMGTTWATGGLLATYKDLSSDPIRVSQRSYTDHLITPTTVYPGSDLRSALISAHQALGVGAELRLDALRSRRDQTYAYYGSSGLNRIASQTTSTLVSPSIDMSLPGDWTLTLSATRAKDESEQYQGRESASTGATTVVTDACFCNESRSYEAGVEGPLFAMAGGDARLAAGAGYRKNAFVWADHSRGTDTARGDEGVRFAYAEINLPLVGPQQGIAGIRRLALTAAVRGEDYDSFGRITTPKFGLVYSPSADFTVKASWGKSFKAPTLFEQNYANSLYLDTPGWYGGTGYADDATVLVVDGGNPRLDPERARTWSASLAIHPEALPGLEAEVTWFDIDYTDRVVQPIRNAAQAMSNPIYGSFVDYSPSIEEQAELLASTEAFYNWAGAAYDPSKVVATLYTQYQNASRQRTKGLDLSGAYRIDLGPGGLTLRGSATWLDSVQQYSVAESPFDLSGTLFNPAKVVGRAGAVWTQGGLSSSLFANYIGGVKDAVNDDKGASFTTFDATLRYTTGPRGDGWADLELGLSVQNLLDRAPPLYSPSLAAYAVPYDSTNYSAIGRYVSVSLSKHW
ncbi:TonB-dependent receptor [plant metagenome]|uniref:TonB-dependent receptor n=1 Tax=plant metagenome TaxID=1297885 RepID=A0A484QMZ6_9ZZZZ